MTEEAKRRALARARTKQAAGRAEEAFLYDPATPVSAFGQRRKVALCRQLGRLENRIADLEFELGLA